MPTLTLSEARKLSTEEVGRRLMTTDSDDRVLKIVLNERAVAGAAMPWNGIKPQGSNVQPQERSTITDKSDIATIGRIILDSGWRGEGMRDPDGIMAQIEVSIALDQESDRLIPDAQKFWVATLRRWFIHQSRMGQPIPQVALDMFKKLEQLI